MKKVFIVILNFNGYKNTIECLESLYKLKLPQDTSCEYIVVDNASSDNSVENLKPHMSKIFLIENKENLGFTGGCNEGARMALSSGADYVMFLNNDTTVDPGLVENLLKGFDSEKVGGVVPKIYFEKGFEYHHGKYRKEDLGKVIWYAGGKMDWNNLVGQNIGVDEVDSGQFDEVRSVELSTGCCFMVRSDVLESIGSFDDKYFLYYEDADLSQRIRHAGFKIIYEPKAVVWHKNAESSGGSGSDLQDYYISRNRMLFGMKYAPVRTKIALAREGLNLLKNGRKWQKKGISDSFLRKFGRGSYRI